MIGWGEQRPREPGLYTFLLSTVHGSSADTGTTFHPRRTFDPLCATPDHREVAAHYNCLPINSQTQVEVYLFLSGANAVALPLVWWHLRTLPLLFWKCPPQTNYPPTTSLWEGFVT